MTLQQQIFGAIQKGLLEAINFSFDDTNNDIVVKHNSKHNSTITNAIYDFCNCSVGDPIYKDNEIGFNRLSGKLIGYCVVPAGVIDDNPRFAYKTLLCMNGNQKKPLKYMWKSGKNACKKFRNEYGDNCFYMPNYDELLNAFIYAFGNGLNIPNNVQLWTSTIYKPYDVHATEAHVLDVHNGKISDFCAMSKDKWLCVIPFFTPTVKN